MSDNLSDRQRQILAAIVEQYAEVASPVGSVMLAKLFKVSSATIRNDMAELERAGYIKQPHTSAGRIPTDRGYRLYVNNLELNRDGSINRRARAINSRISAAGDPEQTIRGAVRSLVELTHNVGLATIGDSLYVRGFASLFNQPEMSDYTSALEVARLLDNLEPWLHETAPDKSLSVYIGHENPIGKSSGCSLVVAQFRSPYSDRSFIGILGPTRQHYSKVMGLVEQTGKMLDEVFL